MSGGRTCQPGCTCRRHSKPKCPDGCTCAKHSESHRQKMREVTNRSWQSVTNDQKNDRMATVRSHQAGCEPGCQCGRHHGQEYNGESYSVLHKRVEKARGKASAHRCADCDGKAAEWSMKRGTNGTNPQQHYEARCVSCHRRYDADSYRVPNKKNRSGGKD